MCIMEHDCHSGGHDEKCSQMNRSQAERMGCVQLQSSDMHEYAMDALSQGDGMCQPRKFQVHAQNAQYELQH
jgi:hypothetical protein